MVLRKRESDVLLLRLHPTQISNGSHRRVNKLKNERVGPGGACSPNEDRLKNNCAIQKSLSSSSYSKMRS